MLNRLLGWLGRTNFIANVTLAVLGTTWTGVALAANAAWGELMQASPILRWTFFGLFAILTIALCFSFITWLNLPPRRGSSPRLLKWYKHPLQRISFDFDNSFGLCQTNSAGQVGRLCIPNLSFRMRVNGWSSLNVKAAYFDFRRTGRRATIRIDGALPDGLSVPTRQWFGCTAAISQFDSSDADTRQPFYIDTAEAPSVTEFFARYGAFDLVIEHERGTVRKSFSRAQLRRAYRAEEDNHFDNEPPLKPRPHAAIGKAAGA